VVRGLQVGARGAEEQSQPFRSTGPVSGESICACVSDGASDRPEGDDEVVEEADNGDEVRDQVDRLNVVENRDKDSCSHAQRDRSVTSQPCQQSSQIGNQAQERSQVLPAAFRPDERDRDHEPDGGDRRADADQYLQACPRFDGVDRAGWSLQMKRRSCLN